MAPSKKWMNFVNDRLNEKYKAGVVEFLDYAFSKMGEVCEIRCPCVKCNNTDKGSREVVAMHLNVYGMLYWKDAKQFDVCSICGVSRWKEDCRSGETKIQKNGKKVSTKTMRYFPLKPRLQRLFMSRKTASDMRWHHESRVDDGVLRHPADSLAWKSFDETHKEFSSEPRNVRLGLASDGFQPFSHSQRSYSIWPVILIPYNMPPWICMKESNLILSMLLDRFYFSTIHLCR